MNDVNSLVEMVPAVAGPRGESLPAHEGDEGHHEDAHDHAGSRIGADADVVRFVFAGRAVFTLVSKASGTRFTYRVRAGRDDDRFFVEVLTGPDTYTFLGTIFGAGTRDVRYFHGKRSAIGPAAPSAQAFKWFAGILLGQNRVPSTVEFWHAGSCGRCGRELTDPASIETGLGPVCAEKE